MIRGRVLLGARVAGPAAVWVLRRVEVDEADALTFYRQQGRPDVAEAIERAVAELREAARLWRESAPGAAADGSAEGVDAEAEARSKSDGLLVTTGWVATRLGITSSRVRQLARAGSLRGRRDGGLWLVERASVDEYAARRELRRSA